MSKILIVDDDEGIVEAIEAMLQSEGYETDSSMEWDYLLNLNKNHLPDLILLDVLLSGKDGRELCRLLKNQSETKEIPIIMISAHPTAENGVKESGADSYLKKPFEVNDLLSVIRKHL